MNQQEIFTYIQKQYPTHPDTINKSGYPVTIFKNPRTAAPYAIFYQPAERTTFMEVQAEPDMIGNDIEMYHLAEGQVQRGSQRRRYCDLCQRGQQGHLHR